VIEAPFRSSAKQAKSSIRIPISATKTSNLGGRTSLLPVHIKPPAALTRVTLPKCELLSFYRERASSPRHEKDQSFFVLESFSKRILDPYNNPGFRLCWNTQTNIAAPSRRDLGLSTLIETKMRPNNQAQSAGNDQSTENIQAQSAENDQSTENNQAQSTETLSFPMTPSLVPAIHSLLGVSPVVDTEHIVQFISSTSNKHLGALDYDKRSPMHVAASLGNLAIVKALVENGANMNAKDRWNRTPLDYANAYHQVECVDYLEKCQAEAATTPEPWELSEVPGSFLPTPGTTQEYLLAAAEGDLDRIQTILATGLAVDSEDANQRTAAHLAACEGHLDVLSALQKAGLDLNRKDRWGNTALDDAIRQGQLVCANALRNLNVGAPQNDAPPTTGNDAPFKMSEAPIKLLRILRTRGARELWALSSSEFTLESEAFGRGSGGQVLKGRFRCLPVIAKTLSTHTATYQSFNDFCREISLMAYIRHPHICLFMGACFESSPPVILIEYCEGGNLEARLIRAFRLGALSHDRLDLKQRVRYCLEISQAMTFLHGFHIPIVHRDLKPSNILLTSGNEIKVTDFGLAKFIPGKTGIKLNDQYEMTGVTGSYRYMAPEVYKNEPYGLSVDVYSAAMVFYWICAGIKPFASEADPVAACHLAATEGKRPSLAPLTQPEGMDPLLETMWHQDATKRPTFAATCDFLEKFKDNLDKNDSSFFNGLLLRCLGG